MRQAILWLTYETDVHGNANTALDRSANVVAIPSDTLRDIAVDAHDNEEASHVLDSLNANSSQDGESKHREKTVANHENA